MDIADVHVAVNTLLECSVCYHVFEDPRVLPCGHTFCFKCISSATEQQCPACRAEWSHPLQKNFVLSNFIASLPSSMSECALSSGDDIHDHVEYLCMSCTPREPLCEKCAYGHIKFTSNHMVRKIKEIDQSDIERHKEGEMLLCKKHIKQELTLYCNTCEVFGCNTCYVSSHNKHNYIGIEEMNEQITTKYIEMIVKLQNKIREQDKEIKRFRSIEKNFNDKKETFEEDINVFMAEIKRKFQEEFDKIINEVDECHKKIIQLANEKVTVEMACLKQMIADAETQLQNLHKILKILKSQSSSSVVERARVVKDIDGDNVKDIDGDNVGIFHIVVDNYSSRTFADSSKWKSDMNNWLQLLFAEMKDAYSNIPLPYVDDTVVIAEPVSRSRLEFEVYMK